MTAADRILGTVSSNIAKQRARDRAETARAKAEAEAHKIISDADLTRAASLGVLKAAWTSLVVTEKGLTGAENAVRAMIGRRG